MNQSQVQLMSSQYGGLDVRTQQGLTGRDEADCSGRCPAAVPTGNLGWLVLKSDARVLRLDNPAGGPCGRSGVRIRDEQNCVYGRFNNFCLTFTPASRPERTVRDSIPDKTVAADPTAPELKISVVIFCYPCENPEYAVIPNCC